MRPACFECGRLLPPFLYGDRELKLAFYKVKRYVAAFLQVITMRKHVGVEGSLFALRP
jgi:hypothetical protein